jgi:hypothetical protein
VTGISGGQVSQCRVSALSGSRNITGIGGSGAAHCAVQSLTHNATGSSGTVTGISSQQVVDCQVRDLSGGTGSAVNGIAQYFTATGCTVTAVANSGAGNGTGYSPGLDGHTLDSYFAGGGTNVSGIVCGGGNVVRGCTFSLSTGTGINATGLRCVVENNAVNGCTTGISVTGANGLIIRNRITFCVTNITASASSQTGPAVTATGTIASTNPWANFTD